MATCVAYLRGKQVVLHPEAITTSGALIFSQPVSVIDCELEIELNKKIRELILMEPSFVPHPTTWSGMLDPLTRAAKVRSQAAFMNGTKVVLLRPNGSSLLLMPTVGEKMGRTKGFWPLNEKNRSVDLAISNLAAELMSAFDDAVS